MTRYPVFQPLFFLKSFSSFKSLQHFRVVFDLQPYADLFFKISPTLTEMNLCIYIFIIWVASAEFFPRLKNVKFAFYIMPWSLHKIKQHYQYSASIKSMDTKAIKWRANFKRISKIFIALRSVLYVSLRL